MAPLPCRLGILRPAGRYLLPGAVARLEYGPVLESELGQTAQEHQRLTQTIARLQAEAATLNRQLKTLVVPLADLARAIATGLGSRPAGRELPPLGLLRLAELYRLLNTCLPGAAPKSTSLPLPLREDRAQAFLERWCADRMAQAKANTAQLPPDIAEQAVVVWETLQASFSEQISAYGLLT